MNNKSFILTVWFMPVLFIFVTYPMTLEGQISVERAIPCICEGDLFQAFTLTAEGTAGPFTYAWSGPGAYTSTLQNPDDISDAGQYSVVVTNAYGCEVTLEIYIPACSMPSGVEMEILPGCSQGGGSVKVTEIKEGTAPYIFSWDNGGSGDTQTDIAAGYYAVGITDAGGCTLVLDFIVPERESDAEITAQLVSGAFMQGSGGQVEVSATGSAPPFSFAWSNGDTDANLGPVPAGVYQFTLTDADGCRLEQQLVLEQLDSLQFSLSALHDNLLSAVAGQLTAAAIAAAPPFQYLEKIQNVSSFYTWEDHVCINFEDKTCMVDGIMQNAVDAQEAYLYNGWLQLSNDTMTRFVHLMQPESEYVVYLDQVKGKFSLTGKQVDKDWILFRRNMEVTPETHTVSFEFLWYDFASHEVVSPVPKRIPMVLNFCTPWGTIFTDKDKFALYNDELELGWQLDFSTYKPANEPQRYVSKHLLGPWQDKLYAVVHYEKPSIMEVDPLSGAILREWSKLPEEQTYTMQGLKYDVIPYLRRTFLDKEKNVLGCLSEIAYWEIDLLTGEFTMINLQTMFEELEMRVTGSVHDSDYVYFTAKTGDSLYPEHSKLYVGAYNRHTHQVDKLYSNPKWSKDGWFYEIGKAGNRIYIKQGGEYLHVFEKN